MRRQGKKLAGVARALAQHIHQQQAQPASGIGQQLAQLAGAGGAGNEEHFLWPCNVQAWQLWLELQTQWRHGFNGRTGLDYGAVLAYLRDIAGLRGEARRECMQALRAAELAVLEFANEVRAEDA